MISTEKKIQQLKQKLVKLGSMHPGSINEQYNVCGKPVCKCKDKKDPVKHGPYYQLSYAVAGKSSSKFLNKVQLPEARKQIKTWQEFKRLTMDLALAYVDLAKITKFERK